MAAAGDATGDEALATALLPHDLSPWGMFMNADMVVKAAMLGLAFASVITWTVFLAKAIELWIARGRTLAALVRLSEARSLSAAAEELGSLRGPGVTLFNAVQAEFRLAGEASPDGLKERVASRLERGEAATARLMARGTGILATIGSTAPFVGLFGTVWGIMNSFIGISKAQTTNLAVVAPGIAEALLATAIGLVAAIPAVVIYNLFARAITANRASVADTSAAILRLVSRELDRNASPYAKAAE
jgi:biopolymer transport protein ExbB